MHQNLACRPISGSSGPSQNFGVVDKGVEMGVGSEVEGSLIYSHVRPVPAGRTHFRGSISPLDTPELAPS